MSNKNFERDELLDLFLEGKLPADRVEDLVQEVRSDPTFLQAFRANLAVDFLMKEKNAERVGTYQGRRHPQSARLTPQELEALTNEFGVDSARKGTQNSYPDLKEVFPFYSPDTDLGDSTPLHVSDPIEMPSYQPIYLDYNIPSPKRKQTLFGRIYEGLGILSILFLGILILCDSLSKEPEEEPSGGEMFPVLARLTDSINAVWEPGTYAYKRNQELGTDKLVLRSGLALLEFQNGAKLLLKGPCDFTMNGPMSTYCAHGEISANVPPSAVGFEIVTPFGSVIDRGTEFSLALSQEKLDVDVHKGKVDLSASGSSFISLIEGEGESRTVGKREKRKADFSRFFTLGRFREESRRQQSLEIVQKNERRNKLLQKVSPVVYLNGSSAHGNTIPNRVAENSSVRKAILSRASYTGGALSGERAILFDRRNVVAELPLTGKYDRLTLSAMVRLDSLKNQGNVLFCSNEFTKQRGGILWQILRDGRLQLFVRDERLLEQGIQDKFKMTVDNYIDFTSEPVFSQKLLKTWTHLAVVLDGPAGTVSFYVNGMKIHSAHWKKPIPLDIRTATIGNYSEIKQDRNPRFLGGALSEFFFFDRALTEAEIQLLQ